MKFSEQWLREWVNPDVDSQQLVKQLTMAGLEVDGLAPVASEFTGVVIGKILTLEPHPQADRLTLCQVQTAADEQSVVPIVCGATNLYIGMKVPVATIGATFADGFTIKKAKLRGEVSHGMLCSAAELGLADNASGIFELPIDAPLGEDLHDYLQLNDQAIDIDLTPNRGDCLSIRGVAREVATLNQLELNVPSIKDVRPAIDDVFPVELNAPSACPRYVGRVITGINSQATTPIWMQERLRRCGLRHIDPVVDVTNYVMLELGQPMHAFDRQRLDGSIVVRMAQKDEALTLLDGQKITLDEESLVIADQSRVLALAGIMGGEHSGINDTTQDIFLESAYFDPAVISGRARRYGLSTDSSHRFERGVDPQLQTLALHRATELLLAIVGGQAGPVIEAKDDSQLPTDKVVPLRRERVHQVLGIDMGEEDMLGVLQRLGMTVYTQGESWEVQIPSYRFDLTLEVDLIEELARIHGYHNLPTMLPDGELSMTARPSHQVATRQLSDVLVDCGYHEVISYSFVDPQLQQLIDPQSEKLNLLNPLSSELSQMRTTLWPGLLATVLYNQHRQQPRMQLFEKGLRFVMDEQQSLQQQAVIAGCMAGSAYPEQWGRQTRGVDFFDIKADVEQLLALSGDAESFEFNTASHAALHPGQTAEIMREGRLVGWLGALHPKIEHALEFTGPVYLFELQLDALMPVITSHYQPLSKFPAIRRDLSFIVDKAVTAQQLQQTIKQMDNEILRGVQLFDLYQGAGIPADKKSIALALSLQHAERTLVDEDVNIFVEKVISVLKNTFHIEIRE